MREAIEGHVAAGVVFAHAGSGTKHQTANGIRGEGRGIFKARQLLDLVDHAQAIGGMHEEQGGIDDGAKGLQCFDEVVRCFEPIGIEDAIIGFKTFPAGEADPHVFLYARLAQNAVEVAVLVAGLAHKAEGLPKHALEFSICGFGVRKTLVAREKYRRAARHDNADCFFKARIMARGPGDIRHMLAVTIDHQRIDAMGGHAGDQLFVA